MLQTSLRRSFADDHLVEKVSSIDFEDRDQSSAKTGRGAESIGASITSQASSQIGLPDEDQSFSIPMYRNPEFADAHASIDVRLEPDLKNRCWRFAPVRASVEAFEQEHCRIVEGAVKAAIKGIDGVPVLMGSRSSR